MNTILTARDATLAVLTVCLNSGAQLLLRGAALKGATPSAPLTLLKSPLFVVAITVYAASVLCWVTVLKRVPLPTAIPFVALMYVIVPIASWRIFGDALNGRMLGGMALVIAGIVIVARG